MIDPKRIAILLFLMIHSLAEAQQEGDAGIEYEFSSDEIIQDRSYAEQERQLLEAIDNQPDSPDLLVRLAELYRTCRYYDKAVDILNPLIAKHPTNGHARFCLGQILGSQQRDPDRAIAELQEAIRLEPDNIDYRHELVSVYHRLQRFPPALDQIEHILARDPGNSLALYRKAVILHIRGNIEEAESILNRLPDYEHARVLQAIITQQKGGNAKPLFESILRDYPTNIRARYEYGKALMNEKRYDEALRIFERVLDEDPFYQHALFQAVKIYSLQKEKKKAALAKQSLDTINRMGRRKRNFYRSYLRHHPDTLETHLTMGLIYLEIGRGNLAKSAFDRVLSMDSSHQQARLYLAQICMAGGDFAEALPHLEKLIEQQPQSSSLYSLMAHCYLESNDPVNARKFLQKSLELDPRDPHANRLRELWSRHTVQSATKSNE